MRYVFLRGTIIDLVLLEETDVPAATHAINNHELTQFLARGVYPQTEAGIRAWIERCGNNPADLTLGICLKHSETIIGAAGLHKISHVDQIATLGIAIYEPWHHGKGIGTEVVTLLTNHAFQRLNLRHVRLSVLGNNPRGQRCYENCGFAEVGRYPEAIFKEGAWVDEILMIKIRP